MFGRGEQSLRAAVEAAGQAKILGVSLLTSMPDKDAEEIYIGQKSSVIWRLLQLAKAVGVPGVVCSVKELEHIVSEAHSQAVTVVPGIRGPGDDKGDQVHTAEPNDPRLTKASFVVIGRPITRAPNPREAAERIKSLLPNTASS